MNKRKKKKEEKKTTLAHIQKVLNHIFQTSVPVNHEKDSFDYRKLSFLSVYVCILHVCGVQILFFFISFAYVVKFSINTHMSFMFARVDELNSKRTHTPGFHMGKQEKTFQCVVHALSTSQHQKLPFTCIVTVCIFFRKTAQLLQCTAFYLFLVCARTRIIHIYIIGKF